jgi:RecA-family ATPase
MTEDTADLLKFKGIPFKDLYYQDLPPIEFLVDNLIVKKGLAYVYGPSASFKTNFLLYIALLGYVGKDIFNFKVSKPFTTLWIDEENGLIGMKDKLMKISKGAGIDINEFGNENLFFIFQNFKILSTAFLIKLDRAIAKFKPDMIVIDSIAKVFDGDERNEKDVARIFDVVKPLINKYGVSIIFIHHARKIDKKYGASGLDDISGSREFGAMADTTIYIQSFGQNKFLLKQTKNRYGVLTEDINFEVDGDDEQINVTYLGTRKENVEKAKYKKEKIKPILLKWITDNPQKSYRTKEIVDAMKKENFKDTNIRDAIKLLVKKDKVLKFKSFGEYEFVGGAESNG